MPRSCRCASVRRQIRRELGVRQGEGIRPQHRGIAHRLQFAGRRDRRPAAGAMLASIGARSNCGIRRNCSWDSGASRKTQSAPASRHISARSTAFARPWTAIASVRARMVKSWSTRASTAALILATSCSGRSRARRSSGRSVRVRSDPQHQRHGARLFEQAHRVLNVDGIGVTIAGASPHRNIDGIGHTPDGVRHFLQSQKARSGPPNVAAALT